MFVMLLLLGFVFSVSADTGIGEQNIHKLRPSKQDSKQLSWWQRPVNSDPCTKSEAPKLKLGHAVDKTHLRLSKHIHDSAEWFDNHFGSSQEFENYHNHSFIRAKTGIEWGEGDGFSPRLRLQGKADLPRLKRRLSIVASSTSDELFQKNLSGTEEVTEGDRGTHRLSTAIRWTLYKTRDLFLKMDGGIRFSFPLDPYAKLRFEHQKALPRKWQLRFSETLYTSVYNATGETTQFDFTRPICQKSIIRLTSRGTYSDESDGLEWLQGVRYYYCFGKDHAIAYYCSVYGVTRPKFQHDEYNIGLAYRKQFYRPWLFYVVEPEFIFPREDSWDKYFRVILSLECIFGKNPGGDGLF
ncbi:MAG: hypothetical protein HQL32_00820 [Planctomycetes bacterium]|nr:hypothetical protein [Planctomycetota bacterium]